MSDWASHGLTTIRRSPDRLTLATLGADRPRRTIRITVTPVERASAG